MEEQDTQQLNNLKQELETLKVELTKFKELFNWHKHTGTDMSSKISIDDYDISVGSSLIFRSDGDRTSSLDFAYTNLDTAPDITRFKIFQEENGGNLLIQSGAHTASPTTSVEINDSFVALDGVDEIFLTSTNIYATGLIEVKSGTAVTAGGIKSIRTCLGGPYLCSGSGVPTLSATKGSLYLRTDGSSTSTRAYINTNGSTTWTAITTAS